MEVSDVTECSATSFRNEKSDQTVHHKFNFSYAFISAHLTHHHFSENYQKKEGKKVHEIILLFSCEDHPESDHSHAFQIATHATAFNG